MLAPNRGQIPGDPGKLEILIVKKEMSVLYGQSVFGMWKWEILTCPNWVVRKIQREHCASLSSGTTLSIQGIQFGILLLSCQSSHTTARGTPWTTTLALLSTQPAQNTRAPLPRPSTAVPEPANPRERKLVRPLPTTRRPRRAHTTRAAPSPRGSARREVAIARDTVTTGLGRKIVRCGIGIIFAKKR